MDAVGTRPVRDGLRALPHRLSSMPRPQAVGLVVCAASLLVWSAGMAVLMLSTRASDYSVYRAIAPTVLDGRDLYASRLNDLAFTYPAFAALPLSMLGTVGFRLGLFLLTLASLVALIRTVVLLSRAVLVERDGRAAVPGFLRRPGVLAFVLLAVVVWFAPVTKTLLNGQINLLLLWLVVEDVVGDVPPRWRGILTGIATGLKLTPGLFIVTMLLTGRRVWAVRATVTFAATVAMGFAVEPVGSLSYWRHLGGGAGYGNPAGYGNQSVLYAAARIAGDTNYLHFLPIAAVILGLTLAAARRLHARGFELATWGVTAIAMLAITPVSWTHHWVWMMLPLAAMIATLPVKRSADHPGGRTLVIATVVVLWSGIVSLAPHLHLRGPGRAFGTEVIGNADLIVGLALLAWFARLAWTSPVVDDLELDLTATDLTAADLTAARLSVPEGKMPG